MRILITEDEEGIISFMVKGLEDQGFAVDVARNCAESRKMAKLNPYDLITMDFMLPDGDGINTAAQLRELGITAPIIMLTVIDDVENIIKALNAGVDDYMPKPFSFEEFVARVRALMRRERTLKGNVLKFEDIVLDTVKQKASRHDREIDLSRKEFMLLEYFMRNPEIVLTRNMILEHVWDYSTDPFTNTVDVHVRYLRKKLDEPFPKQLIQTVHGVGYKLSARQNKYYGF